MAALPSACNVPILAERLRADSGLLTRVVLVSTISAFGAFGAFGTFDSATVAVAWVDARAVAPAAVSTIGQAR